MMMLMMVMMMMMMEEVDDDDDIFASIRGKSGLTFFRGSQEVLSYLGVDNIFHLRQYLWWSWSTMCLQARPVRVTVGDSGLCLFVFCMTSFER